MTTPVTIDYYPPEVYEKGARALEEASSIGKLFTQETGHFSRETSIVIAKPTVTAHDSLFETHRAKRTFAEFAPPPNYHSQSNRFFSAELIPFLNMEEVIERFLKEFDDMLERRRQEGKERSHLEKLKNSIITLLESLQKICDLLNMILGRVYQFGKI